MRNALRRFALAVVLAPAAVGAASMIASPAEAAPVAAAAPAASAVAGKASEQGLQSEINRLINVQRVSRGCSALVVNAQLTAAARTHSAWMAQSGQFSHTGRGGSSFVTRSKAAGFAKPSAENIAWGYRSAAQVVDGWMKSPGHRTNILNCKSTTVGLGAVISTNGTPYYTQDFGY